MNTRTQTEMKWRPKAPKKRDADFYYSAPSNKVFEEVKEKAIEIWQTYDNQFGYVDEKVGLIEDLNNIKDNFMYMVAMFDIHNQQRLAFIISKKARKAIYDRLVAGGQPEEFNVFNF